MEVKGNVKRLPPVICMFYLVLSTRYGEVETEVEKNVRHSRLST